MAHLSVHCIVKGTIVRRLSLPTPAVAVTTADQAEISLQQTVILGEESRFSVLWLVISLKPVFLREKHRQENDREA